jgi:hypothetical protein
VSETTDLNKSLELKPETIGREMLSVLLQEIRLLPEPWDKLAKAKQDVVIDRLRKSVDTAINVAVHMIASQGHAVIAGTLGGVTIKNGVRASVEFHRYTPNLHELYDSTGKSVMMVIADAEQYKAGMNDIQGESDQRAIDLGNEYTDRDGEGMDDIAWPALATADPTRVDATARLAALPNDSGVYTCSPDIDFVWSNKKNKVQIGLLQLRSGNWIGGFKIDVGTMHQSSPLAQDSFGPQVSAQELLALIQDFLWKRSGDHDFELPQAQKASFRKWVREIQIPKNYTGATP